MAREFATAFYKSQAWERAKRAVHARSGGLCERCASLGIVSPARIVHHKTPLTPDNIGDFSIALDPDALIDVCMDCHAILHSERPDPCRDGFAFDASGRIVRL